MEISEQLNGIRTGHIMLSVCCLVYLAWWSITFNPMKTFPSAPKYVLFFGIVATGLTGGVFLFRNLAKLPEVRPSLPSIVIAFIGVAAYFLLLYLTSHFIHRQVTTELFLIVGWAVMELCVLSGIYGAEAISSKYLIIMAIVVIIAAIISMLCYLKYYELEPVIAFFDGMVPLVLFGVVMAVEAVTVGVVLKTRC